MTKSSSKPSIEQSIKLLWIVSIVAWVPIVVLLLHSRAEVQTFAQASQTSMRIEFVALFGAFWSLAGAWRLTKLKKSREA